MSAFALINSLRGTVDLVEGQETGSVVYTQFQPTPAKSIRLTVSTNAMNIFATAVRESITHLGFNFELSAQIPAGGGTLNYQCET